MRLPGFSHGVRQIRQGDATFGITAGVRGIRRGKSKNNFTARGESRDQLENGDRRFPAQVNQHAQAGEESGLGEIERAGLQPFAQRDRFEVDGHEFQIRRNGNAGRLQPLALVLLRGSVIDLVKT